ncbi:apelin receptor-like [Brachionus plicatilis]|uniref:Apelin receptor-like n=1 Tax=Brachionus plicatilis TaxID=10195 RepID=A0A3M7PQ65_BRAPC|nr:apelin receptor-like [Brachionus plicatilis]
MNKSYNFTRTNLVSQMNFYFLIIVIPIGLAGNIFSYFICTTKKLTKTKLGFFIKLMSITNVLKLLYMMFFQFSDIILDYDLTSQSDYLCKMILYFRRIIRKLSPYIEILMTLDRFIAVFYRKTYPLTAKNNFYTKCFIGIILFFIIIDLPNLFNSKIDQNTKKCVSNPKVEFFNDLSALSFRIFIPFILMLTLNIILSRKVFKTKSKISSRSKRLRANFTITSPKIIRKLEKA